MNTARVVQETQACKGTMSILVLKSQCAPLIWLAAFALITCCSYAYAQSCSIYFTSPAKNSLFRTTDINITASANPPVQLNNWNQIGIIEKHLYGIQDNDNVLLGEFSPFPSSLPYFDSSNEENSVKLSEGRNEFEVNGWIYYGKPPDWTCSASDSMRLFYIKPNDQCYTMVEELDKIPKPANDPTNGFITNQRCIAKYSCSNRPQMEDTTWLTKVVPAFVQPSVFG